MILSHFIVAILELEAVVLALILLLSALSSLRDEFIARLWISEDSWLGRRVVLADRRKLWRTLRELGFGPDHLQAIRSGLDTRNVNRDRKRDGHLLSQRILVELRKSTVRLDDGFSYKDSGQYYIDTMGAMSLMSGATGTSLPTLLDEWVLALENAKTIPAFDVVLVLKDGNVTLARQFLNYNSPSGDRMAVLCKGGQDKSRVKRTDTSLPHETDFEGLRSVLANIRPARPSDFKFRAIAVDDNCTGGSSLCFAMRSFNRLVETRGYRISPVKHAVVLFAIRSDNTKTNFETNGFELHSVLSLGRDEMERLLDAKEKDVATLAARFKDGYGCESSLKLRV
jgi:hypothetical protein